ncbi:MAG: hypothetical protein ACREOI_06975 [bacterium]
MKVFFITCALLLSLMTLAQAQMQVNATRAADADSTLDLMEEFESALAQDSLALGSTALSLKKKLSIALTEFDISSLQHRRRVFDWQHVSSIIIFWVVIIIVFVGLAFSGIQFYISMQSSLAGSKKRRPQSALAEGQPENVESPPAEVAEFEASLQGIKVKSSVLGIIILGISLAFFYLYLAHVYPISEVGQAPQTKTSEAP